jgi:hypothetical protein
MTNPTIYTMHQKPSDLIRRRIMPKVRDFIEAADDSGGGADGKEADGVVTGHELFRALKRMYRSSRISLPFTAKDLIKEASIHTGPLGREEKERFVDVFSDKLIQLALKNPEFADLDVVLFDLPNNDNIEDGLMA